MSTKTPAIIEDLYQVEGKAELVDGEIVLMPPAGDEPGRASVNTVISLHDYEKRTGIGRVSRRSIGAGILQRRSQRCQGGGWQWMKPRNTRKDTKG